MNLPTAETVSRIVEKEEQRGTERDTDGRTDERTTTENYREPKCQSVREPEKENNMSNMTKRNKKHVFTWIENGNENTNNNNNNKKSLYLY